MEYEEFLKLEEANKVTDMLLKLYRQVTRFNVAHPTLRVPIADEIQVWHEEFKKEKQNVHS